MKETSVDDDIYNESRSKEAMEQVIDMERSSSIWTLVAFFLAMSSFIVVAWYSRCTVVIEANAAFSTGPSIKKIESPDGGRIIKICRRGSTSIKKGDVLCWLASDADQMEMESLWKKTDSAIAAVYEGMSINLKVLFAAQYHCLGEMQRPYDNMLNQIRVTRYPDAQETAASTAMRLRALTSFKLALDEWRRKSLIQAPAEGTLCLSDSVNEGATLMPDQLLGYVLTTKTAFCVDIRLPLANRKYIDAGSIVKLRSEKLTISQGGEATGVVQEWQKAGKNDEGMVKVNLDTNKFENIRMLAMYRSGVGVKALIVNHKMRVLEKVINGFIGSIRRAQYQNIRN